MSEITWGQVVEYCHKREYVIMTREYFERIKLCHDLCPAKVVRCKDCKWLGIKDYIYGYCRRNGLDGIIQPDDYCSRGEREEDEDG